MAAVVAIRMLQRRMYSYAMGLSRFGDALFPTTAASTVQCED